ncbi:hypothetical protein Acr_21g0004000 [Actinidia rufa]|uniref:Uncharacterized protein n=1 Tax=Actinidia rufa TaxID=165716 RepID=A0A7J0GGE1_9ERIC|nr:hypothetical protein Acr_21g0004000 [Actinidia rufa]
MLAVDALMTKDGLEFIIEDLFHAYCIVWPRRNPKTQLYDGNHYLRLRKPNQPQTRVQRALLEERPNRRNVADLQRLREEAEGESSGSSGSSSLSSSSSWDIDLGALGEEEDDDSEVEDSEKVADDLNFPDVGPRAELLIEHSFNPGGSSGSRSEGEVDMAPKHRALGKKKASKGKPPRQVHDLVPAVPSPAEKKGRGVGSSSGTLWTPGTPELWAPKFTAVELGRELTSVDSSKDHETAWPWGKLSCSHKMLRSLLRRTLRGFSGRLVRMGAQDKVDLVASEKAATHARNEAATALGEKNKALLEVAELQKVAPSKLSPQSHQRFIPILFLDFNEEEYANENAEGEEGDNAVVARVNEPTAGDEVGAMMAGGVEAEGEAVPRVVAAGTEGLEVVGETEGENMPEAYPGACPAVSDALIKRSRSTDHESASLSRIRVDVFKVWPYGAFCCQGVSKATEGTSRCLGKYLAGLDLALFLKGDGPSATVYSPLRLSTRAEGVVLPFKATNSHVADKQSDAVFSMLDILDFSSIRDCGSKA